MVDAVINGYLQVLVIVLCMAFFCPEAALVAVVGVLLSAFALRGIGRQSARTAPVGHRAQEALSGAVIEYIHGLPVVKSFGQEGVSSQRFLRRAGPIRTSVSKMSLALCPGTACTCFL